MDDGFGEPLETISPWSKDKLELLKKYLRAYSTIMNSEKKKGWLRRYYYIDAFASIGQYVDPETRDFVYGSPVVALTCDPPFDEYWFIELSEERIQTLKNFLKGVSANVHFFHGDANTVLQKDAIRAINRLNKRRGFVFLDPYGLEVDFATVQALGKARTFDVFINFSVMGITRLLPREQFPDARTLTILARVMGDAAWVSQWLSVLYDQRVNLFGEVNYYRRTLDAEDVAKAYQERVQVYFPYVSRPLVMRNTRGGALYVLFLASHNRTAVKITNDIIDKYERERFRLF